jgi:hypothetical protein
MPTLGLDYNGYRKYAAIDWKVNLKYTRLKLCVKSPKTETTDSSETLENIYQTWRHHILKESYLRQKN